jgi:hypothetical protein
MVWIGSNWLRIGTSGAAYVIYNICPTELLESTGPTFDKYSNF